MKFFRLEEFCSLTSEMALSASTPQDLLARAIEFCNEVFEGIGATALLVHPHSL